MFQPYRHHTGYFGMKGRARFLLTYQRAVHHLRGEVPAHQSDAIGLINIDRQRQGVIGEPGGSQRQAIEIEFTAREADGTIRVGRKGEEPDAPAPTSEGTDLRALVTRLVHSLELLQETDAAPTEAVKRAVEATLADDAAALTRWEHLKGSAGTPSAPSTPGP